MNIAVTTTTDELNADGDCSLREAVRTANTNVAVDACSVGQNDQTDTITVPARHVHADARRDVALP